MDNHNTKNDVVAKYFESNSKIICFDLGARNGIFELSSLAPFVKAYGFEPNPEEYKKLVTGNTDLMRTSIYKTFTPAYNSIDYFDVALSDYRGESDFFVTKGRGACSLHAPDLKNISRFHHSLTRKPRLPIFQIEEKNKVKVDTLDNIVSSINIERIDYLKLDTQGSELQILKGAHHLLDNFKISIIKCEVLFQRMYENQGAFSDIDSMLRESGFMFLDIVFSDEHKLVKTKADFNGDKGMLAWADAFYCLDTQDLYEKGKISEEVCVKQAIVLIHLGYISLGVGILKECTHVSDEFIHTLLTFYCPEASLKRRFIKMAKYFLPGFLRPFVAKIYQEVHSFSFLK